MYFCDTRKQGGSQGAHAVLIPTKMAYTLTDTHVHVDGIQHQSVFSPKPNKTSKTL